MGPLEQSSFVTAILEQDRDLAQAIARIVGCISHLEVRTADYRSVQHFLGNMINFMF